MRKRRNLVGLERTSPFLSAGGGGESGGDELLPVPKISQSWMQVAEGWGLDCIAKAGATRLQITAKYRPPVV
jgi:hypothetical protein